MITVYSIQSKQLMHQIQSSRNPHKSALEIQYSRRLLSSAYRLSTLIKTESNSSEIQGSALEMEPICVISNGGFPTVARALTSSSFFTEQRRSVKSNRWIEKGIGFPLPAVTVFCLRERFSCLFEGDWNFATSEGELFFVLLWFTFYLEYFDGLLT